MTNTGCGNSEITEISQIFGQRRRRNLREAKEANLMIIIGKEFQDSQRNGQQDEKSKKI